MLVLAFSNGNIQTYRKLLKSVGRFLPSSHGAKAQDGTAACVTDAQDLYIPLGSKKERPVVRVETERISRSRDLIYADVTVQFEADPIDVPWARIVVTGEAC